MPTIFITGGCGFIGSNMAVLLKTKYPSYKIICLDNLKRRGSELNIARLQEHDIQFIHGDIRNREDLNILEAIDFIIDAAAEPSVMAGVGMPPQYVINTNLTGTINTLDVAVAKRAKVLFLSTSRVYPLSYLQQLKFTETETRFFLSAQQELPGVTENGISEKFPLDKARSIYGATKLASELMIEEYREFYEIDYVINRCGVVAGPYQMGKVDQGIISLWLARHYWKKNISYLGFGGTGKQVRDVLHVYDLFELVDYQLHHFSSVQGQTFNAGGGISSNISLQELTQLCAQVSGNTVQEEHMQETRHGDIPVYISDNTKLQQLTGWRPKRSVKNIVEDTYHWIHNNELQLSKILNT